MTARSKMVDMDARLTELEGGGTAGGTDLEPRVAALEASVADLEARVTALEPPVTRTKK